MLCEMRIMIIENETFQVGTIMSESLNVKV